MSSFKLLGIRPMPECNPKFLKNLNPGELYKFYRNCEFQYEQNDDVPEEPIVNSIDFTTTTPSDLYDLKTADDYPLAVNISAVAGKNGSGKSTLIELLFAAIYVFSVSNEILEPNAKSLDLYQDQLDKNDSKLTAEKRKQNEIKNELISHLTGNITPENLTREKIDDIMEDFRDFFKQQEQIEERGKRNEGERDKAEQQLLEIKLICEQIRVEVYYQLNNICYRLRVVPGIDQRTDALSQIESNFKRSDKKTFNDHLPYQFQEADLVKHFFYTIAVNYSHYALNALHLGDWVNALFHKNDGYKTPVVINPMRDDGNFDINKEMIFAKYRLLNNVVTAQQELMKRGSKESVMISDKHAVSGVQFTLNENKITKHRIYVAEKGSYSSDRAANAVLELLELYYPDIKNQSRTLQTSFLAEPTMNYIVQKIDRIAGHYPMYRTGYDYNEGADADKNAAFLQALKNDHTHITFKLEQAIHFLYRILKPENNIPFGSPRNNDPQEIFHRATFELPDLITWIGEVPGADIIRHLPPSIFNIDFELTINNKAYTDFSDLSSGEQQMIHAVQSVIYHLNNLQSVHYSKEPRVCYSAINIIYDEIELYFHPAYQRNFIYELRLALSRLYVGDKQAIRSINILFLTHSPFILSDIPQENILLLQADENKGTAIQSSSKLQTFAANIHDLLADSFFLDETLMGRFAEQKIIDLIEQVKASQGTGNLPENDEIINLIGDDFLRNSINQFRNEQ